MTRQELQLVLSVLNKIKNPDGSVRESITLVEKDLARREDQRKNFQHYEIYEEGQW